MSPWKKLGEVGFAFSSNRVHLEPRSLEQPSISQGSEIKNMMNYREKGSLLS